MVEIDNRNARGFKYDDATESAADGLYFPLVVDEVMEIIGEDGGCLVEAGPGTGKSHLLVDLQSQYTSLGVPNLTLNAMINGGSKKGAGNALYVLDEFTSRHASDGVILVDNADYYGYSASGRGRHRNYQVAKAHTVVARYLQDCVVDSSAPAVLATAHTDEWRRTHWKFPELRPDDEVTEIAQSLLDSFISVLPFAGTIDTTTARGLVSEAMSDDEFEAFVSLLQQEAGSIYFRHLNHFNPQIPISPDTIHSEVQRIDAETSRLIGQTAVRQD